METVEAFPAGIKSATPSKIRPLGQNGVPQRCNEHFQMPLHYPRYTREEYKSMPEWKLDCLLIQYGLPTKGSIEEKRRFAIGAFCWTTPSVVKMITLVNLIPHKKNILFHSTRTPNLSLEAPPLVAYLPRDQICITDIDEHEK